MRIGFIFSCLLFSACPGYTQVQNGWTILYYAAGSNSSEVDLMADVQEMMKGKTSSGYRIILMIDRIEGHSNDAQLLNENFTDTRLYELKQNSFDILDGYEFFPHIGKEKSYEANMGDAQTLKNFIDYGKKYFLARHYMLIMRSHGNGQYMCADLEEKPDFLFPAEMSDVLTQHESVDILGLDVCSMAGLENLYEWRPTGKSFSAEYVLASAALSAAWAYDQIFERVQVGKQGQTSDESDHFGGTKEHFFDPLHLSSREFATLLIEEIYDSQPWCSWGLFDMSKIEGVKLAIDELVSNVNTENKKPLLQLLEEIYRYHHGNANNQEVAEVAFPYADAYELFSILRKSSEFSIEFKNLARKVCTSIDELVIQSYHGSGFFPEFKNFTNGKNGVYLVAPGNKTFSQTGSSYWSHCTWYHSADMRNEERSYGLFDWCKDGAVQGNKKIENWFELLDFLLDDDAPKNGGVNKYDW